MKKAKHVIVGVTLLSLLLFAFSGCKKFVLDGDGMVNSEPVSVSTTETVPAVEITQPSVQKGVAAIYNDQLIFRVYGAASLDPTALGCNYSDYNYPYTNNSLYAYDFSGKEAKEFMEDKGYGKFYVVDDMLYSQEKKESGGSFVYSRSLKDGDYNVICNGEIKDFSADGKFFMVDASNYEFEEYNYFLYDVSDLSKPVYTVSLDSSIAYNYQFIGLDDSHTYFIRNDSDYYTVVCYSIVGDEHDLATYSLDDQDYTYGVYEGEYTIDNSSEEPVLTFTLNHYEGTGLFYSGSTDITVNVAVGVAKAPEASKEFREGTTDPQYKKEEKAAPFAKFETPKGTAFTSSVWECENFENGTFFVLADSLRYPFEDVGWRYAYTLLNLHYYFLDEGSDTPVLLKDMYAPGGTKGLITEVDSDDIPQTVYAFVKFVGTPGVNPTQCIYQLAIISGPEMPIEYSPNYYSAEISKDCLFETLASDDLMDWEIKDLDGFTKDMENNKEIYIDSLPDIAEFDDSYDVDEKFDYLNSFCCHLGFDKDGKVNYIRPVVMD